MSLYPILLSYPIKNKSSNIFLIVIFGGEKEKEKEEKEREREICNITYFFINY